MHNEPRTWQHYAEILDHLKTFFPVPTSNPIMDGYFVHTISNFLDRIDSLKSAAPILDRAQERRGETTFDEKSFPERMSSVEELTGMIADYCQGAIIWAHPNCQAQVIAPPTMPSIMAFIASAIYNPNILSDEYSARFAEAEIQVISLLCDLIGYDPDQAGGIFTFGGTGTILYGCKLGLEKLFSGQVMTDGLREDVKIVTSESSHYSKLNVAGWLGLGTKNVVAIPTTRNNEMSLTDLENYLRAALERGEKIAAIVATLGTTDAFGIDDLAAIVHLRDRLTDEYKLEHPPHIHADSVIGWAWLAFRDYDFQTNPLGFHARTLRSLRDSVQLISALSMADSLGIDFHKTGYAPFISSALVVKNRKDLSLLSRAPEQMPYLYQFGRYNPGIFSLECSRSGASALAALANIRLFGKEGYRVIIGHVVEMSEMLRERLEAYPFVEVLNDYNYGPVTLFRVYPDGVNPREAFQREQNDPDYRKQLEEHNAYNRKLFEHIHEQAMSGKGVLLSWTDAYRHASYPQRPPISAIKSFIMSPWTGPEAVETVARQVAEIRNGHGQ